MLNKKLEDFICNDLKLDKSKVRIISKLNSLNNTCYKVEYLNKEYFMRIYDSNTYNLIKEKNIMTLCFQNNITPKTYYFSTKTGNVITEWIDGHCPSEAEFSSYDFIKKLVDKLKLLHNLKTDNLFNPFDEIINNLNKCKLLNLPLPSYIDELVNTLHKLENYCLNNMDYGLCHNDLNPSNIILSKNQLYLVDYEFSAYGDIFYDLAYLSWLMTSKGRKILLETYFEKPDEYHKQKLSYYIFVVKFWNATWSLLKSVNNDHNYDYRKGAEIIFEELHKSSFNINF